ncbi:hypothetical protein [Cupriavidus sp. UYPR2.512]|uniref:hypothetical protein n=1 Tax=Cupriavidus sp. UYPR2.512 TaxID=1080187 RepID=UPI0003780518|nr:hypothetical protein [Cupriavidus sp. UYPR2.512]UIF90894.1 hypothetical protein KAF44_32425 [Cupriavidus necator]
MAARWIAGALAALIASCAAAAGPTEDAQFGLAFAKQTKTQRVRATGEQIDRFCNPYIQMPARLAAVCSVYAVERSGDDPAVYVNITNLALKSLWQVTEALDRKAISEDRAKDAIIAILDRRDEARMRVEVSRSSSGPAWPMPYDSSPSGWMPSRAHAAPSAPVRTRCDRVPFSVTGTVNCVTE